MVAVESVDSHTAVEARDGPPASGRIGDLKIKRN